MGNRLRNILSIVIGLALLVIVLPFMLNWLLLRECPIYIVGGASDWLQFWPVYLGAIGTITMTIVTYRTLIAYHEQMKYMITSEGAQLVFSLSRDYEYVLLKVTNVGRSVAKNIQLSIPNRLAILERNAGMPFGDGLIRHLDNLNPIPLLLPNQSDCIPLYMYRALGDSIKDKNGIRSVEVFGDTYSPENITVIAEYFKNETFTVTGFFVNYLDQKNPVNQIVDNTYNVSLSNEDRTIEHLLGEFNKNLVGIKAELHSSDTAKLKDIDTVLEKAKLELHSISDTLKKIEGKIKK